ncbi:trypsin-like peptidase domain-containing protein [Dactylosporangium aurantiacum]|uniref:Trypsin-like peptidase domain-containing protein n=1 Tax=Dactylosporangium aurantiacum TaxID=35754 RepID=A0A9Q9MK90_9ACTN|nr:trypsin-like peptidase domain-containing protein [Dactylosporangium aurantiacum]MDG6103227.1 trypsin-like peptidase domain-containing protein [Dactylosporangium aurantiacum]UWZ57730.1 trypsin-like peptidase domain-containing protein [Dactylosporangium aurantiacum]
MDLMPPRAYVPVTAFAAALERAARSVVLVTVETDVTRSSSTGWLITDDLVVTTGHLVGGNVDVECHVGDDVVPADVVHVAGPLARSVQFPDWRDVALLRLRRFAPGMGLPLAARTRSAGEPVLLVHRPESGRAAQVSFGRLAEATAPQLVHDADTGPGSAGAPVLSMRGHVVGMAIGTVRSVTAAVNAGVTIGGILDVLQDSRCWHEIVEYHDLVDWAAVRARLRDAGAGLPPGARPGGQLWCAVRWSIDPARLDPADSDAVRPLVGDPAADRWVLRGADRQRILAGAGSLDALRAARGADPVDDPRQRVIDRILAGPPFAVDEVAEDALPLWLQAVRWFAGTVPGLPSAATVSRQLERRRLRGRLAALTRPHFWGRQAELRALTGWYGEDDPPPMTVTGIGGIGKSCLAARFAGDLPADTVILWLDFDRADLAPDDAESMLSVLAEQLSTQADTGPDLAGVPGPGPFGAELARATAGGPPPLLVLDGFEIAQHAERHSEVWRLLDRVLGQAPRLRVLVVGRAPVHALALRDRPARRLALEGLDDTVATEWLARHGVTDPGVLTRVLTAAHGVPLVLQLAERLLAAGGSVEDLPKHLVEGFLYRRILDRVVDAELQPLARDALVLRRVTPDIIGAVLHDSRPAGADATAVFRRLAHELALVAPDGHDTPDLLLESGPDVLRLRPEVRAATLALLARDDADRVREIDARAAAWYAGRPPTDGTLAELVYHRLRLDDVPAAAAVWREEVAPLLAHAADDLPPAARAWLVERLAGPVGIAANLAAWERNAAARIRDVLARGLDRLVPDILAEHPERGPQSPLVVYDAWVRWSQGDVEGALAVLGAAPDAEGPVERDRRLLAALLARHTRKQAMADELLASVKSGEHWQGTSDPELMALGVWAARIRLTVDVAAELRLLRQPVKGRHASFLPFLSDKVILPALVAVARQGIAIFGEHKPLTIPVSEHEVPGFAAALAEGANVPSDEAAAPTPFTRVTRVDVWRMVDDRIVQTIFANDPTMREDLWWSSYVTGLHWRRLAVAASDTALSRVCARAMGTSASTLSIAVVATLYALRGNNLRYHDVPLDDLVEEVGRLYASYEGSPQSPLAEELAATGNLDSPAARLYFTGPDPLETLVSTVLRG